MISPVQLLDDDAFFTAMVSARQAEIEHPKPVIAKLRRMQFGRRSERLDEMIGQHELSLDETEAGPAEYPAIAGGLSGLGGLANALTEGSERG